MNSDKNYPPISTGAQWGANHQAAYSVPLNPSFNPHGSYSSQPPQVPIHPVQNATGTGTQYPNSSYPHNLPYGQAPPPEPALPSNKKPGSTSATAGASEAPGMGDFDVGTSAATSATHIKLQLIRKIYALVTLMLAITVGITCFFMFVDPVRTWVVSNQWFVFVGLAVVLVAYVMLFCVKKAYPWNGLALCLVTLGFSIIAGTLAARYKEAGSGFIVLQAFLATSGAFLAITLFCFVVKKDFSFIGGFLGAATLVIFIAAICTWALDFVIGGRSPWISFGLSVLFGANLRPAFESSAFRAYNDFSSVSV